MRVSLTLGVTQVRRKRVNVISAEELSSWPTKRLLGRLKSLRHLHENPQSSDISNAEIETTDEILFKNDPRWKIAYSDLKAILDTREHIQSGKSARQARAR